MDERRDESVLCWFGYIERMEKDRIAKRVYMGRVSGLLLSRATLEKVD